MPRQITIDSYSDTTGDLKFTVTGAANNRLNRTFTVNNLPVGSKDDLMVAIRAHIQGFKDGLQAEKRAAADNSITSILGQAQTDAE